VARGLRAVKLSPSDPDRYRTALAPDDWSRFTEAAAGARSLLAGRTIWNLNSTARGGGVAEMLAALVPLCSGFGLDVRWLVIEADSDFFKLTKRLHNLLHSRPDGSGPDLERDRARYEAALKPAAEGLGSLLKPDDILVVHDPQPAGVIPAAKKLGVKVVWRCHVGTDNPGDAARRVWRFLLPYVGEADATVFSRNTYIWDGLNREASSVIAPSIDPFSPKNQELAPGAVAGILEAIGLTAAGSAAGKKGTFTRTDGTFDTVQRHADVRQTEPLPTGAPMVVQVSRWDRLKDPVGVVAGFAGHLPADGDAHLVLAGPAVVEDDPEGQDVLTEVLHRWKGLPAPTRRRVHLLSLPLDDVEENAAMVNALQRQADVIVQKSLEEGFGLTVAEAMWKGRAVLASRRGGIQDQIVDGESGVLLDDPTDLREYGERLHQLLAAPDERARLGKSARERVSRHFLAPRQLIQWGELLARVAKV
jgi:trehalose synthase